MRGLCTAFLVVASPILHSKSTIGAQKAARTNRYYAGEQKCPSCQVPSPHCSFDLALDATTVGLSMSLSFDSQLDFLVQQPFDPYHPDLAIRIGHRRSSVIWGGVSRSFWPRAPNDGIYKYFEVFRSSATVQVRRPLDTLRRGRRPKAGGQSLVVGSIEYIPLPGDATSDCTMPYPSNFGGPGGCMAQKYRWCVCTCSAPSQTTHRSGRGRHKAAR